MSIDDDLARSGRSIAATRSLGTVSAGDLLRRRQRGRRLGLGVLAVSLLAGAAGVLALELGEDTRPLETGPVSPGPRVEGTWQELAAAPIEGRIGAGAVWTGREMIVWGGIARSGAPVEVANGAAYDPTADSWRTLAPAPPGVLGQVGTAAAWNGEEAVFWAGNSPDGPAAGAAYDPESDTWRRLADGPLGPREGYSAVWTGTELLIIAGTTGDQLARPVAAALDPSRNSWRLLPALNDLPGLAPAGVVWNGERVFIAGSLYLCPELGSVCTDTRPIFLAYDPATDTSQEIDLSGAPVDDPSAALAPLAWTGTEVVFETRGESSAGLVRYNPSNDEWNAGRPAPCAVEDPYYSQSAWLGDRYVVPCGVDRLQIYDPRTDTWESLNAGPSPFNTRTGSSVVWTGTELIAWSGTERRAGNPTPNDGSRIEVRQSASAAPASVAVGEGATRRLDFGALGPIRLGMTIQEAEDASGADLLEVEALDNGCVTYEIPGEATFIAPDGTRIRAIVVTNPTVPTARGVGVGDPYDAVIAAYADLEPEVYPDQVKHTRVSVITAPVNAPDLQLVFQTTPTGTVESVRTGYIYEAEVLDKCLSLEQIQGALSS